MFGRFWKRDRYIKVSVIFERRPDGGLRAYSDDVPGLVLSGHDANAVFEDVIPAIEVLLLENSGIKAKFKPVMGLRAALENDGFLPPKNTETREYVAPYSKAA